MKAASADERGACGGCGVALGRRRLPLVLGLLGLTTATTVRGVARCCRGLVARRRLARRCCRLTEAPAKADTRPAVAAAAEVAMAEYVGDERELSV